MWQAGGQSAKGPQGQGRGVGWAEELGSQGMRSDWVWCSALTRTGHSSLYWPLSFGQALLGDGVWFPHWLIVFVEFGLKSIHSFLPLSLRRCELSHPLGRGPAVISGCLLV